MLLSGGLDSSLLVGLLADQVDDLLTFSIGFEGIPGVSVGAEKADEFEFSDRIAERFKTRHHKHPIPNSEVLARLPEAVAAMTEPMMSHDLIAFYLLSERVSKEVKVVLAGQGADEVFGGYFWYPLMDAGTSPPVERFASHYFDRDHAEYLEMIAPAWHVPAVTKELVTRELAKPQADTFLDEVWRFDARTLIVPLSAIHGSGGGYDQGLAFAGALAQRGIRVMAMSRFGYLRTPMPADAKAAAQADSAAPIPPWVEKMMMRVIGSDSMFWAALHVARDAVIKTVLATPPELLATASAQERTRVNAILHNIVPVSARAEGLRSDTAASKHLRPSPLQPIRLPTLVISARDDRYGTYASAQYTAAGIARAKFIGFDAGGHTWVGHNDEVLAAIVKLLDPVVRP